MPLPTPSRQAQRFLGDAATKTFHDLFFETEACKALEIITKGKGERFMPDRLEYALSVGYKPCPHCLSDYAEVEDEPEEEPEAEAAAEAADGEDAAEKERAARKAAALKRAAARKAAAAKAPAKTEAAPAEEE